MNRRVARLGLLLALAAGCAGSQIAADVETVRAQAKEARRNGALRCAPRELALAEVNADFAETELGEGDYFRAREHLETAQASVRDALRRSPAGTCGAAADRDEDQDWDGVADAKDRCPTQPEDRDGFEDEDGCPDLDNDKDEVADAKDRCPLEAEDRDGFEDEDGCPDPDDDKDGVLDQADKCPRDPGPAASDGCPKKYEHIVVTDQKIELKQKIFFQTNKAVILPRSYGLLSEIAQVLKARPTMRLRVEGHTDSVGPHQRNMALSQARAEAVKQHLAGLGAGVDRMEAVGFGPDQPIETNRTGAGREKNRRVEFVIIQQ